MTNRSIGPDNPVVQFQWSRITRIVPKGPIKSLHGIADSLPIFRQNQLQIGLMTARAGQKLIDR